MIIIHHEDFVTSTFVFVFRLGFLRVLIVWSIDRNGVQSFWERDLDLQVHLMGQGKMLSAGSTGDLHCCDLCAHSFVCIFCALCIICFELG